ncbi:MAG: hypothetical protein AB7O62_10945 [Pirellulales bacterium]
MKALKYLSFAIVLGAAFLVASKAEAGGRSYYYGWKYYPRQTYYYTYYYYKPTPSYPKYDYHTCVYYPSRPSYVYYYNPVAQQYWGRYDLEQKGYSLLAPEDRSGKLSDIPESAFPKPASMPEIPDSTDGETIPVPPAPPKDAPADAPQ